MKNTIHLTIKDSVWTIGNKAAADALRGELSYDAYEWRHTALGKRKVKLHEVMIYGVKPNKFLIPTGLMPRAEAFLKKKNLPYELKSENRVVEYSKPHLKGIKFRDYQSRLIEAGLKHGRGVLQAATGTGKSIVLAGLISAFDQERILFLVHTVDLVKQMADHLQKVGIKDFAIRQGSNRKEGRIILSTIQTFSKEVMEWCNIFDVVLIDEVHHVNAIDSKLYGKTLQYLFAPVKIGVTATLPDTDAGKKQLEALIGPVICEYSINEASKEKVIAKPKVRFLDPGPIPTEYLHTRKGVPKGAKQEEPSLYGVIYYNGIVRNFNRNMKIISEAAKRVKKGKSVLIKVLFNDHGRYLLEAAENMLDDIHFVNGNTPNKERERIKHAFNSKKIKCVIATDVYKEGIDIKSLNTCIIAAGLKSEITTYQNIGRGVRLDTGKDTVEIIDFKDSCHKYLRKHSNERYRICKENKWITYEE